jgi:hypothetical protein
MRWAALAVIGILLCGCETTAETSARREREAKRHASASRASQSGLSIPRASTNLKVVQTALLQSSERAAAVVTLRNASSEPLRAVPIAVTVKDLRGSTVYTNSAPGLAPSLVSAPFVPGRGELTWINDQVTRAPGAAAVSARVGEGSRAAGGIPALRLRETRLAEDPANGLGEEGTLANESHDAQQEVVIYAVARRGQTIVAAGRAVLAEVAAGASVPFQIFFVGDPRGAHVELTVAPKALVRG